MTGNCPPRQPSRLLLLPAALKLPERILLLDRLPKGPTGKLQRIGMAARLDLGN